MTDRINTAQNEPLRNRLKSGRVECPSCGKKGVGYATHPHALRWRDYGRASCRYCHKSFKIKTHEGPKDD